MSFDARGVSLSLPRGVFANGRFDRWEFSGIFVTEVSKSEWKLDNLGTARKYV